MVLKPENSEEFQDEWIALIIFEYRNVGLIGVDLPGDGNVSISLEGGGGVGPEDKQIAIDSNFVRKNTYVMILLFHLAFVTKTKRVRLLWGIMRPNMPRL